MTKRHIPVAVVFPSPNPIVVGATPTLATKTHFGTDALKGILTAGNLAATIPLQPPYAGQGAVFPAFPNVEPSSVAPNARRTVLLTALNLWSPSRHSKAAHTDEPVPAQDPDPNNVGWAMPQKTGQRLPSTAGTLPFPPNIANWPTFIDRMQR